MDTEKAGTVFNNNKLERRGGTGYANRGEAGKCMLIVVIKEDDAHGDVVVG